MISSSNKYLRNMNKKLKDSKLKQIETNECIDALETIDDELIYFNEENKRKLSMSIKTSYRKSVKDEQEETKNEKILQEKRNKIFNKRKNELDKILNVSGKGN